VVVLMRGGVGGVGLELREYGIPESRVAELAEGRMSAGRIPRAPTRATWVRKAGVTHE
jgi:hypothetical protein